MNPRRWQDGERDRKAYSIRNAAQRPRNLAHIRPKGRAQVGKPGLHRYAQVILVPVLGYEAALVALAEFTTVGFDEETEVCKSREVPAEGFVER
jgi:hypothetical protein